MRTINFSEEISKKYPFLNEIRKKEKELRNIIANDIEQDKEITAIVSLKGNPPDLKARYIEVREDGTIYYDYVKIYDEFKHINIEELSIDRIDINFKIDPII